jgi:hypothetical protein
MTRQCGGGAIFVKSPGYQVTIEDSVFEGCSAVSHSID